MAMSEPVGSDILTPSNCGPCLNENKHNEATLFCVECNDMLCDMCVGIHKRFPTMKTHQIVVQTDKEQFEFTAKLLTDKCEMHEGKHLETFCKKHDEFCCSVCVFKNHRKCKGLVLIPEHAKRRNAQKFCKDKIEETKQMKSEFEQLIIRRKADKIKLEQERRRSRKKIDDYRQELVAEIDRIHTKSLEVVKSRHERRVQTADEDLKICNDLITELDKVIRSFESETVDNTRRFIGTKRVEEEIKHMRETIDDMTRKTDSNIEYKLEATLKDALMKVKTFQELANNLGYRYERKNVSDYSDVEIGTVICQRQMPEENEVCSIQGIILIENCQVMITDWNNRNIKLLNNNLEIKQLFPLPGKPRALCMIENDICVSYRDEKKVEIVAISGTSVTTKQTLKIGEECQGVCYRNSELFVACGYKKTAMIRVYSMEGKLKRRIDRDALGDKLFYLPFAVKTNADGSLLFVGDHNKGVIALKIDGTLLWKCDDSKVVRSVRDIAVDENDDLYVSCCFSPGYIVKIYSHDKKAETLLNGIRFPSALCYDSANGGLILSRCTSLFADTLGVHQATKQTK